METWIQRFVSGLAWADVPPPVQQIARRTFTDTVGVMLAGAGTEQYGMIWSAAEKSSAVPHFTAGHGMAPLSLSDSVFLNAAGAHSQEFNDLFYGQPGHPSAPLVPMLLNLAETAEADGEQLLTAYTAGFEVTGCLNRSLLPQGHLRGFHTTSVAGAVGCAAAAGKLMGLDAAQLTQALALAATFACGLRQNFGTGANSAQVGLAAVNGLRAARLARAGLTAAQGLLAGGFAGCFGADPQKLAEECRRLGRVWSFLTPGVLIKRYPCCYSTYQAIEAALELRRGGACPPQAVDRIRVLTSPNHFMSLPRLWPDDTYSQRFCVPYCVAAALADGRLDNRSFGPGLHLRPELLRLAARIEYGPDPAQAGDTGFGHTAVTVVLQNGAVLRAAAYPREADRAENWTETALAEKFRQCAAARLPAASADQLFAVLLHLGRQDRIRPLLERLAQRPV